MRFVAAGATAIAILTTACAGTTGNRQNPLTAQQTGGPREQSSRDHITPAVDHHVHVLGPYALPIREEGEEVSVPSEIGILLERRAKLTGAGTREEDLRSVYAEGAKVHNPILRWEGFMDDPNLITQLLNAYDRTDRRFIPTEVAVEGSIAYVRGRMFRVDSGRTTMTFLLALKRVAGGEWRIAVESSAELAPPRFGRLMTAEDVVKNLDEAGIHRAVVLSFAYWLDSSASDRTRRFRPAASAPEAVRLENDWAAAQVRQFPDRLVMACGVNPIAKHGVPELIRCSKLPGVVGMKLHLNNIGFRFDNPQHVSSLRRFFSVANEHGMSLMIHVDPGTGFGAREVGIFLDQVASAAPKITIQLAHLAGDGPGITAPDALEEFAKLRAADDPRTQNLYFDLAGLVTSDLNQDQAQLMVTRMRQIGLDRILFASDSAAEALTNPTPSEQWKNIREKLPLSADELRILASNVAPYLRLQSDAKRTQQQSEPAVQVSPR